MRGDESGLGIDAYHGVSHGLALENIAALERDGAHLSGFSVPPSTREGAVRGRGGTRRSARRIPH
ncbi:hypothetical protein P3L51_32735 [Streptomyces sp. PSRA5]|uniref:hypothetical protein n=1 Tax=Streptomyces panacea TaxID=3035064 RepID=UPI00339BE5EF